MCLSMNVIGNGTTVMFVLGVIIGIIGLSEWESIIRFIRNCWKMESISMHLKLCSLQKKSAGLISNIENDKCVAILHHSGRNKIE